MLKSRNITDIAIYLPQKFRQIDNYVDFQKLDKMENSNKEMTELEEAKKYHNMSPDTLKHLQKPIRGPGRFLSIAMAAAGLGAGWYYLKKRQKSSVADENHFDRVVVLEDSKTNDANNAIIKKPIDP